MVLGAPFEQTSLSHRLRYLILDLLTHQPHTVDSYPALQICPQWQKGGSHDPGSSCTEILGGSQALGQGQQTTSQAQLSLIKGSKPFPSPQLGVCHLHRRRVF